MNVWWFFFKKLHFFSSLSEDEQKIIQLSAEKSRQACLKCNLDVRAKISKEKRLFWKKIICSSSLFLDYCPNFFRTFSTIFQHSCSNCILLFHGGVWAKMYFWGKYFLLFIFKKLVKKHTFCQKKHQGRQNYILCVQRNVLRKNSFSERIVFLIVFVHWPKKSQFLEKKFQRGCQNSILPVEGNVLRKNIFLRRLSLFHHFWNWAKKFRN